LEHGKNPQKILYIAKNYKLRAKTSTTRKTDEVLKEAVAISEHMKEKLICKFIDPDFAEIVLSFSMTHTRLEWRMFMKL